jgi:sugar O-acyltransferase (sialic acid O-acetyltransferase NeuD family)
MMKSKDLVIIGGGDHARVIIEMAKALSNIWNVIGFVDNAKCVDTEEMFSLPRLGSDDDIPDLLKVYPNAKLILAMGDILIRKKIVEKLCLPEDKWATLVHPSAEISPSVKLSCGVTVLSRVIIQTSAVLHDHVIVNNGSILEHDVKVGAFSHIAPGVVTGGGCKIGSGVMLGLGSRLRDHVIIGDNAIIGAGSVVVTDIPDGETAVGIPAKRLSESQENIVNIKDICLRESTMLYEAMSILSEFGTKILLITDSANKLLGILTYGDIRDSLLDYDDLNQKVGYFMNTNFHAVDEKLGRVVALEYMRSNGIDRMPVIDSAKRVVGLHMIESMIGNIRITNQVVVMVGGKGTRLKPLTDNLPKPMVRVAGRPILEHIVFHLSGSGVENITFSVNYLKEMIQDYFQDGSKFGCNIEYLIEDKPFGTAGSLSKLSLSSNEPILVLNGDIMTHFSVENILHTHNLNENDFTIGVHLHSVQIPYGVVELADTRVAAIHEKPEYDYLINAGVYVLNPDIINLIPDYKEFQMTELINLLISSGKKVGTHLLEHDWIDIGKHKDLALARGDLTVKH